MTAHPKSRQEKIAERNPGHFEVWVREAPDKGKANAAIIAALSEHFGIPRSRVKIMKGLTGKNKIFEIN